MMGLQQIQECRRHGERSEEARVTRPAACIIDRVVSCTTLFISLFFAATLSLDAASLHGQTNGAGRTIQLIVPTAGKSGFTAMPSTATGIVFSNQLPQWRHLTNQVLMNGGGVALGDVDADGWCDVFLCNLTGASALYRNLGGWRFTNIAATDGVACDGLTASGAAFADLEGDGDLDLVVNTVGHGTRVFTNDGRGKFSETARLNGSKAGMSLALGDLDGDRFLDLYVANYRTLGLMDMPNTTFHFETRNGRKAVSRVNGRPATDPEFLNRYRVNARGGIEENGEVDEVYRNVGGKGFAPLSFTDGTFLDEDGKALAELPFDWGLSVMMRDFNQDGLTDIWVCNDFDTPDRVWLNQGGGKFRAAPRLAFRKGSHFSMGLDVADINRDGFDDVFVVDMLSRDHAMRMDMMGDRNPPVPLPGLFENPPHYMVNTFFVNRGDGTYAEIAALAGLEATDWSWATVFLDVDLDGYEDVLVANGHERMARSFDVVEKLKGIRRTTREEIFESRKMFPRQNSPNVAFRNRGDLTFEETGAAWGFNFDGVSHGMAVADLDNDGDLDVVVNNLNDPVSFYRNDSVAPRLAVRLKGLPPNTRGIGARITVRGGAVPEQGQEMMCGGRYLSSDDTMRVFAAGSATNVMTVTVKWPGGNVSVLAGVKANQLCEVDEAGAMPRVPESRVTAVPPMFTDVSASLAHRHVDERFDDFTRQPMLPHQLSQLGPGVTWADLDGDGWDDLVVGAGKGGSIAALRNNQQGAFQPAVEPFLTQPAARDFTTILPWRRSSGAIGLIAAQSIYEDKATDVPMVRLADFAKRAFEDSLPASTSGAGPMAMADVDGDGRLDLFVGGRMIPERWPEPASSMLLRGVGDGFAVDATNSSVFTGVGLVSGAVFSDLDGDGDPDLVLACEWGPLKVFRNERGRFSTWDWKLTGANVERSTLNVQRSQLSELTGLWNSVTAADFDGDGRMDLAAGNWGRNTRQEGHRAQPLELWFGDANGDGVTEVVEAYHDATLKKVVPERQMDFVARGMPVVRTRFASHMQYGRAALAEILGDQAGGMKRLTASWLESGVLLNRGDHFELHALPVEAQMAPVFGVVAQDFDGDGRVDLFLAQNFFGLQPDVPRLDAGRGLLLLGDGRGGFKPVRGQASGLLIYGEQRGAAAADFDRDGRIDLAVSQNGAETKLYRNATAKPGLRVRLIGAPGNRDAVGSWVRLESRGESGPAQEIHAGAGYWSQDSPALVVATDSLPARVLVRWPGGTRTTNDVPAGTREITIDASGRLTVVR